MKKFARTRATTRKLSPSPSMVVAILALIVALSGTAYAAATINGKNIKKGTITAKQVKDKSLTGKDIKDRSITGTDVKDASINGVDIADGGVAAADLAAGTIVPPPIGTATSTTAFAVPGIAFTDVPGMTLNYTAPAGTTKLIITFAAECNVDYTADAQYLSTQILVDGTEAEPSGGSGYQFCTVDPLDGYNQITGSSMTRVINAAPGAHTIKVQAAEIILANGTLDDMALTVTPSS